MPELKGTRKNFQGVQISGVGKLALSTQSIQGAVHVIVHIIDVIIIIIIHVYVNKKHLLEK